MTVLDPPGPCFPSVVWLLINLATAILAASVIGVFEDSIRELALLAIFMPIVASMGGIGTTQTATVVVRGLALGDMTAAHLWRVVRKETTLALTIGLANGQPWRIAYVWRGQPSGRHSPWYDLNMVAAVVGVVIPPGAQEHRVDPAIASSVIITTFRRVRVLLLQAYL
jgi:magnesium transporter